MLLAMINGSPPPSLSLSPPARASGPETATTCANRHLPSTLRCLTVSLSHCLGTSKACQSGCHSENRNVRGVQMRLFPLPTSVRTGVWGRYQDRGESRDTYLIESLDRVVQILECDRVRPSARPETSITPPMLPVDLHMYEVLLTYYLLDLVHVPASLVQPSRSSSSSRGRERFVAFSVRLAVWPRRYLSCSCSCSLGDFPRPIETCLSGSSIVHTTL
ncbi:hypothetical protein BO71DRAFT_216924 [Aspergillus ellipticus CBS 707.79]|uniref:Uncharacterized protein n=1 Tax=Aspergillus ellipticus CBS 707.79 TaxID=1448320 RepID=A0A319DCI3_9EURO|nr:hypothetical protein BO71DRAFT_216924 [Aspergillus ellipticus CBS 707.79]